MLYLNREKYSKILLSSIEPNLMKKINVLYLVYFLRNCEPVQLLSFADLLTIKKYELGEIILKKGDELTFFGIISQGIC